MRNGDISQKRSVLRETPPIPWINFNGYVQRDFGSFNLSSNLIHAIADKQWRVPSLVQVAVLDNVLKGRDTVVRAKVGTGKTGAFCISCLQSIDTSIPNIQALIILPKLETVLQTFQLCSDLASYTDIKILAIKNKTIVREETSKPNKIVHLAIATPITFEKLVDAGFDLSKLKVLVLDEADALMANKFNESRDNMIRSLPRGRLNLFCLDTISDGVERFIQDTTEQPEKFDLMSEAVLMNTVHSHLMMRNEAEKIQWLRDNIQLIDQVLVFCNSAERVRWLAETLTNLGILCSYVHASSSSDARASVLQAFRNKTCRILICTDLLTRGIAIQAVGTVINFDIPPDFERYVTRLGRTGRHGNLGSAINLFTDERDKCKVSGSLNERY